MGGPLQRFRYDLSLYRRLVGARIRADWQYRTSFVLFLIAQAFVAVADLGGVLVIFSSVDELAGWSATEVLFLYGISGTAFGLADGFVSPVESAARHIKEGTFDLFLTRPVGALWQLLGVEFALRRFGRLVQPTVVLAVILTTGAIDWSPAALVLLPIAVLSGAAIYASLWVITSAIAFWTVETQELGNTFTYGGNASNKYPIDVLAVWLRRIVTFVVPLASVAYLPAAWLFGKPQPFGLPAWAAWTSPLVALTMTQIARAWWTTAIRHYRSTGS